MRALCLLAALLALPATLRAERPADVLARLRGAPSTNAGALGSAFPQQHVEAYRCVPRLVIVYPGLRPLSTLSVNVGAGPVTVGGSITTLGPGLATVACPAPGWPTTTTLTTVTTTTVVTTSDGCSPAPSAGARRVLAPARTDAETRSP